MLDTKPYQDNKNKAVAHTAGRSGMRVCVKESEANMSKLFKETKGNKISKEIAKEIMSTNNVVSDHRWKELEEGKIAKDSFLKMKELVLPYSIRRNPMVVFALNYDCDSKVGQWTNMAMAICTALAEEFFEEVNGVLKLNKKRFKKAFKVANNHGRNKHYKRIFKEGLNIHTFTLKDNESYKVYVYYVSNREVNEFADRLANLNLSTLTVEDIKNIQADLWYLFRAWQESSIDMTKDKSKQFNKKMDEILGRIDVRTGAKFQDISTNVWTIKDQKYNPEITEPDNIEISLGKYDEENDGEEVDFFETTLSRVQESIIEAVLPELQNFADRFINADINIYERYNDYAVQYSELALVIMDVFRIVKDHNNISKEEKEAGKRLTSRDYAILRAVIYNAAQELGIDAELVVKIAFGVAGSGHGRGRTGISIYTNKEGEEEIVVREFNPSTMSKQLFCVEKVFGNIAIAEKAELLESNMVLNGLLKQEIEARHVFCDVENGIYTLTDGIAYSDDNTMLFDTDCDYTGEVSVEDDGVYYLYDPLMEIDNCPDVFPIFSVKHALTEEENEEEDKGIFTTQMLSSEDAETIEIYEEEDIVMASINNEPVFSVDTTVNPGSYVISKWYGIAGVRFSNERPIKRSNKFMILTYDKDEMEAYVNSITQYC